MLIVSLAHSLSFSLTHSLARTHSLSHSLTHSLAHNHTHIHTLAQDEYSFELAGCTRRINREILISQSVSSAIMSLLNGQKTDKNKNKNNLMSDVERDVSLKSVESQNDNQYQSYGINGKMNDNDSDSDNDPVSNCYSTSTGRYEKSNGEKNTKYSQNNGSRHIIPTTALSPTSSSNRVNFPWQSALANLSLWKNTEIEEVKRGKRKEEEHGRRGSGKDKSTLKSGPRNIRDIFLSVSGRNRGQGKDKEKIKEKEGGEGTGMGEDGSSKQRGREGGSDLTGFDYDGESSSGSSSASFDFGDWESTDDNDSPVLTPGSDVTLTPRADAVLTTRTNAVLTARLNTLLSEGGTNLGILDSNSRVQTVPLTPESTAVRAEVHSNVRTGFNTPMSTDRRRGELASINTSSTPSSSSPSNTSSPSRCTSPVRSSSCPSPVRTNTFTSTYADRLDKKSELQLLNNINNNLRLESSSRLDNNLNILESEGSSVFDNAIMIKQNNNSNNFPTSFLSKLPQEELSPPSVPKDPVSVKNIPGVIEIKRKKSNTVLALNLDFNKTNIGSGSSISISGSSSSRGSDRCSGSGSSSGRLNNVFPNIIENNENDDLDNFKGQQQSEKNKNTKNIPTLQLNREIEKVKEKETTVKKDQKRKVSSSLLSASLSMKNNNNAETDKIN